MYFWGLVKKVVQQVEDLSFFLLFLLFYKKVKKSEKKYKKVFSTFPDGRVIGEYRHRDAPRSGGSEPCRTVFPLAYASAEILVREPKRFDHSMSSPRRRSSSMW